MDLKLKNKVALVLGSSAGIGKAIAKNLHAEGANICLAARGSARLQSAVEEISTQFSAGRIISRVCDGSKASQIESVISFCKKEFGHIDILINNLGGPVPGGFNVINEEQLLNAINTNLLSFFRATKLCIEDMKDRGWGRIINVLSISAKEPLPNMFLSNLIRPAMLGMSKTVAQEYASFGVTMNSVLPSSVLTDRTHFLLSDRAKKEGRDVSEVIEDAAAGLPIKYIASPDEFAQIVTFLCSENASYINGTAIPVDGASSKCLF